MDIRVSHREEVEVGFAVFASSAAFLCVLCG